MPPPSQTGRRRHYVLDVAVRLSVHPFVCSFLSCQTCEHDMLKTSEQIVMQIGTSGPRDKGIKRSTLGARMLKVKITQGQR